MFIGHFPVPDRFAAACSCANRLSCRFVDVDAKYTLQALRLRLMAARRCAGASSTPASVDSGLLALPRFAGVTTARCLLFGANTPWKRARFTRGLGTSAASRAMKSSGSTKSPGAILNSHRLARRAEGRMPRVTSHAWCRPGKAS